MAERTMMIHSQATSTAGPGAGAGAASSASVAAASLQRANEMAARAETTGASTLRLLSEQRETIAQAEAAQRATERRLDVADKATSFLESWFGIRWGSSSGGSSGGAGSGNNASSSKTAKGTTATAPATAATPATAAPAPAAPAPAKAAGASGVSSPTSPLSDDEDWELVGENLSDSQQHRRNSNGHNNSSSNTGRSVSLAAGIAAQRKAVGLASLVDSQGMPVPADGIDTFNTHMHRLKQVAMMISEELDSQNEALESLAEKTDSTTARVAANNARLDRLIKK